MLKSIDLAGTVGIFCSLQQKMHTVPIPPPNPSVAVPKVEEDVSIENPAQLGSNLNASSYYKQFDLFLLKMQG